jgi:predicted phage terminase large subunit-like protein
VKTADPVKVMEALARERLLPFVMLVYETLHPGAPPLKPSWYLKAMCLWLERIEAGELMLSMISIQPRALKSITVAIAFPLWLLGRDPSRLVTVAAYSETLSDKHAHKRRLIMRSAWYQRMFPNTRVAPDRDRLLEVGLTAGGECRAVSVYGGITGTGVHFFILDDCMKADDVTSPVRRQTIKDWFDGTVLSRQFKGGLAIISIQQRLHEDDLPAYLRDKGFEVLCLPARAPKDMRVEIGRDEFHSWKRGDLLCEDIMNDAEYESQRILMGPQQFSAQYLQDPIAQEGNHIRMEHFRRYDGEIDRDRFDKVFQSWDTAASELPTADWSVCTTWGYLAGRLFLLDIYRRRVAYYDLKRDMIALRKKWRADHVILETIGVGLSLWQELRNSGPFTPISATPNGDKATRLDAQSGQIEEGRVYLPAELPGLDAFISELKAFPYGKHDDQVDTLTQVLEYVMFKWRSVDTRRNPETGRALYVNRRRERPPLPPLPEWISLVVSSENSSDESVDA